jgi:hypothetical protein
MFFNLVIKSAILFIFFKFYFKVILKFWELSYKFGDWGLGIGDWGLGPSPNPQSPYPHSPIRIISKIIYIF